MFDVSADDVAALDDRDLRELVGRLCEAELASRGLSAVAVSWGGHQTAVDGGLDVRVSLPADCDIGGFVPRAACGFQVKVPDMPRAAIMGEMRPSGVIRPVIRDLADEGGAYVIVSSKGSVADGALRNRREAMREAVHGIASADRLHTDFYDRTRVATWVRRHPGIVAWTRRAVGRSVSGWRPHGAWSAAEDPAAEYLLDGELRVHLGIRRDLPSKPAVEALDDLRGELAKPGKVARLVGLSGVGKTRFAQTLFDPRIGTSALPPSLAVYADMSDGPDPQPTSLASQLVQSRVRAVMIVDNCPPDLHRRLADTCAVPGSTVGVMTIEYDVRDDQPEGTQVVALDASSPELVERLVRRRHPHVSQVDARTIAEASGGNARIALALAATVGRSETISGLSDEDLFHRLFVQRHGHDDALLVAARTCSLVYSFRGEPWSTDDAELPRLAALADQSPRELRRHVNELLGRDLVQRRGDWRAVLPHALANRLARRALDDAPPDMVDRALVTGASERLRRSFTRRLSYLHDHPVAVELVGTWLAPGGMLGDVTELDEVGWAMLENVAPVRPEAALAALERAVERGQGPAVAAWTRHRLLLRSLAYDPALFARSAGLLARASVLGPEGDVKQVVDTFTSLFPIQLSGTHAPIGDRLAFVERLLGSREARAVSLGLGALDGTLEASNFSSGYRFEFGARSRDHGYRPRCKADVTGWYGAALAMIERLAHAEDALRPALRNLLARRFRGLWAAAHMHDVLDPLVRRLAGEGFWRDAWVACRQTIHLDPEAADPEADSRLASLEAFLKPSSLQDRVRSVVLGERDGSLGDPFDDEGGGAFQRELAVARRLGAAVAADEGALTELVPDLLRPNHMPLTFGQGLAAGSADRAGTWARLVEGLTSVPPEQRDVQVLRGFLRETWALDRALAQDLLDVASDEPAVAPFLPALLSVVQLDRRGAQRLLAGIASGRVPVPMCMNLALGGTTDEMDAGLLRELLIAIAGRPDGFDTATRILAGRLRTDRSTSRPHDQGLLDVGRDLLRRSEFMRGRGRDQRDLARIVRAALKGAAGGPVAAEVARRLRDAIATHQAYSSDCADVLAASLDVQPAAVLDALFAGDDEGRQDGLRAFDSLQGIRANPADVVPTETLTAWCEGDPRPRYPLAASFVTYAGKMDGQGVRTWSEPALSLLRRSPDPEAVLAVFVDRFTPMSWSGSRAAIIEANARLLDASDLVLPKGLTSFVARAKEGLAADAAQWRRWETEDDRRRDERFE